MFVSIISIWGKCYVMVCYCTFISNSHCKASSFFSDHVCSLTSGHDGNIHTIKLANSRNHSPTSTDSLVKHSPAHHSSQTMVKVDWQENKANVFYGPAQNYNVSSLLSTSSYLHTSWPWCSINIWGREGGRKLCAKQGFLVILLKVSLPNPDPDSDFHLSFFSRTLLTALIARPWMPTTGRIPLVRVSQRRHLSWGWHNPNFALGQESDLYAGQVEERKEQKQRDYSRLFIQVFVQHSLCGRPVYGWGAEINVSHNPWLQGAPFYGAWDSK